MVIAGEVSGDMHAAGLVRAIKDHSPHMTCFGIGGDNLRAAGMDVLHDVPEMAALGFVELIPKLAFFRRVFYEMLSLAEARKPDAIILVDYPGFNLRFAARAHALGHRVIYYVCPQVWAWHRSRIPQMARTIDRLITIFPFEPALFEGTGLQADYVGHPLIEEIEQALTQSPLDLPWAGQPRIALLPGSRRQELDRIYPVLLRAAALLEEKHPDASFITAAPSEEIGAYARDYLHSCSDGPSRCSLVIGRTREVLRQARAALVASGTATLETALIGCPMVIAYKVAPLSYFLIKHLVTLDSIGMVNIVAGRRVCPELIQGAATPTALAEALLPLLADTSSRASMVQALAEVSNQLRPKDSHARAAGIVLDTVNGR